MIRPYLPGVISTSAPVFHATLIPISMMPIGLARVRLNLFAIHLNGLNMFLTSCGNYGIQIALQIPYSPLLFYGPCGERSHLISSLQMKQTPQVSLRPDMILIKECINCNSSFEADSREHNRGSAKFCSRKCFGQNKSKQALLNPKLPNVTCAWCSKAFYLSKSKQSKSKSGLFFCEKAHKDLAQSIVGGIREIMPNHYGTTNNDYRNKAFINLPNVCNRCGYNKYVPVLIVHHIDRNRTNNDLSNLEILCPTCHGEEHYLAKDGLYNRVS